jgi:hypothetical protein
MFGRIELEQAIAAAKAAGKWGGDDQGIPQQIDHRSEVCTVRKSVWKAAGMDEWGGCLCIGCLEKRLGRKLKPKDLQRGHPFNCIPNGTPRLLKRRKYTHALPDKWP